MYDGENQIKGLSIFRKFNRSEWLHFKELSIDRETSGPGRKGSILKVMVMIEGQV